MRKINLSNVHYYPNGGTISRSQTTSTSATSSSTFSYSVELWSVAEIGTSFSVSASISQSVGITASWKVNPKQYSQVRAVFPRKSMFAATYLSDGTQVNTQSGLTNRSSGFYITADVWY